MRSYVFLDTGVLSQVTHPKSDPQIVEWLKQALARGQRVCVPEIADYELRRELERSGKTKSIERLDSFVAMLEYVPISTESMRLAARLWAEARNFGHGTAPPEALDGDVILAAQLRVLSERNMASGVIVTNNVKHLNYFVDARDWRDFM